MSAITATRLISASDLKRQRGWTEGLVASLLGAPDALAPNPHGFRPPMRFFVEDRVLDAERDPAFARWTDRLDDRRTWRRTLPTRVHLPTEVKHLEWLNDPRRIALFLAPRVPRRRRRPQDTAAAAPSPPPPGTGFEVLRLFEMPPTAPVARRGSRARSGSASA